MNITCNNAPYPLSISNHPDFCRRQIVDTILCLVILSNGLSIYANVFWTWIFDVFDVSLLVDWTLRFISQNYFKYSDSRNSDFILLTMRWEPIRWGLRILSYLPNAFVNFSRVWLPGWPQTSRANFALKTIFSLACQFFTHFYTMNRLSNLRWVHRPLFQSIMRHLYHVNLR